MCQQDYYQNFKSQTRILGLHSSFDKPGITLKFAIKARKIQFKVKLNRIRELKKELVFLKNSEEQYSKDSILTEEDSHNNTLKSIDNPLSPGQASQSEGGSFSRKILEIFHNNTVLH